MKHFFLFVAAIFLILFVAVLNRKETSDFSDSKPLVRIFTYSSFASKWGPGPKLKEIFEKDCNCVVDFIEGSDSGVLLQRLKLEGAGLGADLVIGLDQFDLQKALIEYKWQQLNFSNLDLEPEIKSILSNNYFVPYDWGVLGFMMRKDEAFLPKNLDDLLNPELSNKIVLQDPRTSSPGLQFLYWVVKIKGEEEGFKFIDSLLKTAHSVTPSWSLSLGLYNQQQVKTVFTYVTSPLYYQIEEKKFDHAVLPFKEAHPVQFEFLGVPEVCRNCELSEKFVNLMLSSQGQKILMERNYMFPVLKGVRQGTPFDIPNFKNLMKVEIPSDVEVDRLLKRWTTLRRGESS